MNDLFSVKEKVIVVTGGTGVLGSVMAGYLANEGAKVVILGRNMDAGEALVRDIKNKGNVALFLKSDVLNKELLNKNLCDILDTYGRLDALINAAGGNMPGATIAPSDTFFDLSVEDFDKVLQLNLTGTVLPTQVFLKPMVKQGKGKYHQHLFHGGISSDDARGWLCCRKSRYL